MVLTLIPELNDCAESGVEISSSKLPDLKTLIVMSIKQYRSVHLNVASISCTFQYISCGISHTMVRNVKFCGHSHL
jgi:hypothetical protein